MTAAGERLINEARLLLRHAEDFGRSTRALGGALQGEIAVGCFMTLAPRFLPALLAAFKVRHPGVTVRLEDRSLLYYLSCPVRQHFGAERAVATTASAVK